MRKDVLTIKPKENKVMVHAPRSDLWLSPWEFPDHIQPALFSHDPIIVIGFEDFRRHASNSFAWDFINP